MNPKFLNLIEKTTKIKILMGVENMKRIFALEISRRLKITHSHSTKMVNEMVEDGLFKEDLSNKNKRTHFLKLTEKGKQVVKLLNKLDGILK